MCVQIGIVSETREKNNKNSRQQLHKILNIKKNTSDTQFYRTDLTHARMLSSSMNACAHLFLTSIHAANESASSYLSVSFRMSPVPAPYLRYAPACASAATRQTRSRVRFLSTRARWFLLAFLHWPTVRRRHERISNTVHARTHALAARAIYIHQKHIQKYWAINK